MPTRIALFVPIVLLVISTAAAQNDATNATVVATHAPLAAIGPVVELDRSAKQLAGLRARYGGRGTEKAVELALAWLARHQDPAKGCWDADGFAARCRGDMCGSPGLELNDTGLTGLSLLAFLGAGHTYRDGPYMKVVADAVKYLRRVQDADGCIGGQTGHYMYSHAVATLAMADAYTLTNSPLLRRPVEKAIKLLLRAQNPNPAGEGKLAWRYTVQPGDNDTSVTGWAVMALRRANDGGLEVPDPALDGAMRWLGQMTDPETGRAGYVKPGVSPTRSEGGEKKWPVQKSEAITALALLARILCGEKPADSDAIAKGVALCLNRLPVWNADDGSIDQYYWFTGAEAMFQVGGDAWDRWNAAMKKAILPHQRKVGCVAGSWDPLGPWGADGGRVYATALMTLCLETYFRMPRLFPDAADRKSLTPTITVRITADEATSICAVDGKELGALPACADQIGRAVSAARMDKRSGVVAIDVDFEAPFGHVLRALEACVAERRRQSERKRAGPTDAGSIRLLIPSDRPFRARQEVRLVRLKLPPPLPIDLPTCTAGVATRKDRFDLAFHVTHDDQSGESHVCVGQARFRPDELKAWLNNRTRLSINPKTKHSNVACWIYCDKAAAFGMVQEALAICAGLDFGCYQIRLAVLEPDGK